MKTTVLCNHVSAIPAVESLLRAGLLGGIGLPDYDHTANRNLQHMAEMNAIPVLRTGKNDLQKNMVSFLKEVATPVVFVLGFPYRIPAGCLSVPEKGFINFHPSLLPAYRGPVPLFWQIRNGEIESGVTVHKMDQEFDSGPLVFRRKFEIYPTDTLGLLENRMTREYVYAVEQMQNLLNDDAPVAFSPQDETQASYYARPQLQDLTIDWKQQSADEINGLVRACNPEYGGALTYLGGVPIRILESEIAEKPTKNKKAGTILTASAEDGILVACHDKSVLSARLVYTYEGYFSGGRMAAVFNIRSGEVFTNTASANS